MVEWWIPYVCLFVTTLVVTLALTPLAGKLAWKLGAVDRPSKRRINKKATPRMGGVAISSRSSRRWPFNTLVPRSWDGPWCCSPGAS